MTTWRKFLMHGAAWTLPVAKGRATIRLMTVGRLFHCRVQSRAPKPMMAWIMVA